MTVSAATWRDRAASLTGVAREDLPGVLAAWSLDSASASALTGEAAESIREHLLEAVVSGKGHARDRLAVGEWLGRLGDPRLRRPSDETYWVPLTLRTNETYKLARFPVTNDEFQAWADAGGYRDRASWSEAGWAWLAGCADPWPVVAHKSDVGEYIVPNQPVVGVTWFEADAYARAMGARLPRWYERVWAVRGAGKRPYPWGDPFGEGNANTREEALGRPCAVGLYVRDVTPEGVYDLAGNAGEWTSESADGDEFLLAPGAWDQESLASWAKALTSERPSARWAALGFRLAKD
jgi:formylglycine-generating enzyme required for sulfatase activity